MKGCTNMKHGFFSKALTLCLAVALLLAVAAPALAVDNTPISYAANPTFTKRLTMESADVPTPEETFTFTITPGAAIAGSTTTPNVLAGPQNAAGDKPSIAAVSFTAGEAKATGQAYVDKTVTIDFTDVSFTAPGVYRYVVTETKPNPAAPGVTYDETPRYLDVYVTSDAAGVLTINNTLILHTGIDVKPNVGGDYNDPDTTVKDLIVKNTYATQKVTLSKTVTGNQGDRAKHFLFKVTISGAPGGTQFSVAGSSADVSLTTKPTDAATGDPTPSGATLTMPATGDLEANYYLKSGESIVIDGLAPGVLYTVQEVLEDGEGYTTTAEVNAAGVTLTNKAIPQETADDADDTVAYTNDRTGTVPTGILMDVAPYALLVAFAGVALLMLTRKRKVTQE